MPGAINGLLTANAFASVNSTTLHPGAAPADKATVKTYGFNTVGVYVSNAKAGEVMGDEAKAAMAQSMPAELAEDTLTILGSPSPAELRLSPDVQRVLGRAPRPFADWAVRNIAAFR